MKILSIRLESMAKRKCRKCGNRFNSKGPGDYYCSEICRLAGFFVGGGGDTSKPGVASPTQVIPEPKPVRPKKDDARFARVRAMFDKPPRERWAIAKDFTEEEAAYARRIAKRMMYEESRFMRDIMWDVPAEGDDGGSAMFLYDTMGDSDDGSI